MTRVIDKPGFKIICTSKEKGKNRNKFKGVLPAGTVEVILGVHPQLVADFKKALKAIKVEDAKGCYRVDRDHNAAINIRMAAIYLFEHGCWDPDFCPKSKEQHAASARTKRRRACV